MYKANSFKNNNEQAQTHSW